eukprot:m.21625 g.21625  ORF g.21625 m.21625 type:complete len:119 (+) comp8743_c0_seq1:40-396(+)
MGVVRHRRARAALERSLLLGDNQKSKEAVRDEILDDAVGLVRQLKQNSTTLQSSLKEGDETIDSTLETLDEAQNNMIKAVDEMKKEMKKGSNLVIYLMMVVAIVLFVLMVVFIQWSNK